jgi:hypothetical protein
MISSIDPPPAYEVVGGLNQLGEDVVARTTPNRYPSGDRLSSELGSHLAELVSREAHVANTVSAALHDLEMILLMTIETTQSVDRFPTSPTGASPTPTHEMS